MIIRINGVRVDDGALLQQLPAIEKNVYKLSTGWKVTFALSAATLVMDAFLSGGSFAAAAGMDNVDEALKPIKDFLISLADPICYIMFVWGCIETIVGRAASGLTRIKYAAIGFIAINWIPVVMGIIREAGAAGRAMG